MTDPYAPPLTATKAPVLRDPTVPDRYALAVTATVANLLLCTCAPLGVVALWHADASRKALAAGQRDLARRNSELALRWAVVGLALAGLGLVTLAVVSVAQLSRKSG